MKSLFLAIALSFVVLPLIGNLAEAAAKPCVHNKDCPHPYYQTCTKGKCVDDPIHIPN